MIANHMSLQLGYKILLFGVFNSMKVSHTFVVQRLFFSTKNIIP